MFQKDNRVRISNGSFEQSFGIRRIARNYDFQSGTMGQKGLYALRVIRSALDVASIRHADDYGAVPFAVRPIINIGQFIEQLIHSRPHVICKLNFRNRLKLSDYGHTKRQSDNGRFRKRCVKASLRTEFSCQVAGNAEDPSLSMSDVLSKNNDMGIALHLLFQSMV